MRILICHGYLLKGTGSNQYVQFLARELCRQGHNLALMCQDDDPALDFVSTFIREVSGGSPQLVWERRTEYPGTCMVYRPDIGDLLPVYVLDSYPGFRVKEFPDLDEGELRGYVEKNRLSLARLVETFAPEAINVNHTVMLPYIARPVAERNRIPYFVTVHGSAIDFAVRKDPRYLGYGAEGLAGATGIVVLSEHSGTTVQEVFGDIVDGLDGRISIVPPGVDTGLYRCAERSISESVRLLLEAVERRVGGVTVGDFVGHRPGERAAVDAREDIEQEVARINTLHPDWLPEADVSERLRSLAEADRPFLIFVGKLLETKGIQCVLPALPLVMKEHAGACLLVVGFGELRGILQLMLEALHSGDVRALKDICEFADREYTRTRASFAPVLAFLEELAGEGTLDEYLLLCREMDLAGSVIFTGYLAPEEHSYLLPHARAMLVPSLAPEAFGLVAIEAMACGVTPIAPRHSGLATALEPVCEVWGDEAESLFLNTPEKLVFRIAAASRMMLEMPEYALRATGERMREAVIASFSWESAAKRLVALFDEGGVGY